MKPLTVLNSGMVTGVGHTMKSSCAAIRCGITGFVETRFMFDGEWLMGCPVPLETPIRGRPKLLELATSAIREAIYPITAANYPLDRVPLLMCLSEPDRPGRFQGLDDSLLRDIEALIGSKFHGSSSVLSAGRTGGAKALAQARQIMDQDQQITRVLVCGVDTLLVAATLTHYYKQRRLMTAENSDGFIPGEAACAVLLGPNANEPNATIAVTGVGFGSEPAPIDSEEPLRADGLAAAIKAAVADAKVTYAQMAYRLTDNAGEQYGFKEAALAMARTLRPVKPEFDIQHPADCIGEVGAATVPSLLAVAHRAERKEYAPGREMGDVVLCQVSGDGADRAAFIVRSVAAIRDENERAA